MAGSFNPQDTDADDDKRPDGDDEPIARCKERFGIAAEVHAQNRKDALDDIRFARLAEQWPVYIRRERELDSRPCLTINRLPAFIRQVVNDARQNKPAITVHPVGSGSDPETAEVFNGLIRHIEQSSDADVAYDTALDNSVTGGFGYFRVNTRYSCDDNFLQDLVIERIADPLSVYGDPNDQGADSANWNEAWVIDSIPKGAFVKRWPRADRVSFSSDTFTHRPVVTDEEMVDIAEWWTREEVSRTITAVSAPDLTAALAMPDATVQAHGLLNDSMIIGMDVYEANKELFQALGMKPVGKTRDVMTYKVTQRICSGAEVLETVDWAGKYIPIIPVYGEEVFVEGVRHLRSLVRDAKDPQRMFNYWRTTSTELVALAPKIPFIGKKGQFETDAAKWATANTQSHAYIEYDAPEQGDAPPPQRQPFASVPAGAINEAANAADDIKTIVGIYNASLGAPSNEVSGVAINARDKQADTGTFHFIDNLSRAIRHCGRVLIDLIPHVYSTPRMLRILGPDLTPDMVPVNNPQQPAMIPAKGPDGAPVQDPQTGELQKVAKVFDLTVGTYDLTVSSGPSYASQRQEAASQMIELIRAYPAAAPLIGDLLAKNLDWPGADEIADRMKAMLPAAVRGQDPALQEAHSTIQQGMQLIASLKAENAKLKGDQSYDQGKLEVDRYKATTDRMEVVAPQGMPTTPEEMQAMVMAAIQSVIANPDLLMSGMGEAPAPQPEAGGMGGIIPPAAQPPMAA